MRSLMFLFAIVSAASSAHAQEARDIVTPNNENCTVAEARVRERAAAPERMRALEFLSKCGEQGGAVLADELRRMRDDSDTIEMQRTFLEIARIRDGRVFQAALDLAADRGATIEARIVGFRVLVEYHVPDLATSFRAFMLPRVPILGSLRSHGIQRGSGLPLPAGWEAAARNLMFQVAEDPSESEAARHAARQAISMLGLADG